MLCCLFSLDFVIEAEWMAHYILEVILIILFLWEAKIQEKYLGYKSYFKDFLNPISRYNNITLLERKLL